MQTDLQAEISERELELMHGRCAAASPGPWFSLVVGRDLEAGLNCIELGCAAVLEVLGGTVGDQDFIAYAREDVPRLIAEVRRLRAERNLRATAQAVAGAPEVMNCLGKVSHHWQGSESASPLPGSSP